MEDLRYRPGKLLPLARRIATPPLVLAPLQCSKRPDRPSHPSAASTTQPLGLADTAEHCAVLLHTSRHECDACSVYSGMTFPPHGGGPEKRQASMSKIKVVAVITAAPGVADLVASALRKLVESTRTEAGCISYDLYRSDTIPDTFVTVESWRDQRAMELHGSTAHVAEVTRQVEGHLAATPVIHILQEIPQ